MQTTDGATVLPLRERVPAGTEFHPQCGRGTAFPDARSIGTEGDYMDQPNTSSGGGGIVNTVRHRAAEQLTSQKGRATDGLDALAQAVRNSTERLRTDRHEMVAGYVDRAADHLERFSTALRDKDVDEILRDAQNLARRQPALVIGGSFLVGMIAARFLKSSQPSGRDWADDTATEYGTGQGWASASPQAGRESPERF
jgi:hypothetical protein